MGPCQGPCQAAAPRTTAVNDKSFIDGFEGASLWEAFTQGVSKQSPKPEKSDFVADISDLREQNTPADKNQMQNEDTQK